MFLKKTFFAAVLIFCGMVSSVIPADYASLNLPVYFLTVDQEYLDALEEKPYANVYYPAEFLYGDILIPCEVRYRGATSRGYPKKSWRVKFNNNNNIFNTEKLNLDAAYNDSSSMRNFLANRLFEFLDYPAPVTSHISLFINDEYAGVFIQVEQVDEYFLERTGRKPNSLYKALNHGANMSPLTHDDRYANTWEKKLGNMIDNTDIKVFFSKARYWTNDDFERYISNEINIDDFLKNYAVLFSISSTDNFSKNFYLYFNPESDIFEMFPWDNDATFGNRWTGEYLESYETFVSGSFLAYQVVFQRLMEIHDHRNRFWNYVNITITDGFDFLDYLIDETYETLQNDVYRDTQKKYTNEDFDNSIDQLHSFLAKRSDFLKDFEYFNRIPLSDYYCSNPFPSDDTASVVFRVTSDAPQKVFLVYSEDLDFSHYGDSYSRKKLELFDDGLHNDLKAGDLIYGNNFTVPDTFKGLIPYAFTGGSYYYPHNGFAYINYYRTHTFALNCMNTISSLVGQVKIGEIYKENGNFFVEIRNDSPQSIDISYCYLRGEEYFQNFLFPENTVLKMNESLVVAQDNLLSSLYFKGDLVIRELFFDPAVGDRLKLLAPDFSVIDEKLFKSFVELEVERHDIVINEINYNSADNYDTGDWVELYNADDENVDISGWVLKDNNDNHEFVFPLNTLLPPDEFLVICRDISAFQSFSNITNCMGNLSFGLSGAGEQIRLYDEQRSIVDSLTYDDKFPWPEEPDGNGATLSLKHPQIDNSVPENWASSDSHGTPGIINDVYNAAVQDNLSLGKNYPNPFNQTTTIPFSLSVEKKVAVDIFNAAGQHVSTPVNKTFSPGLHKVIFDAGHLSNGVYLYTITTNYSKLCGKLLLLK